MTNRRTLFPPLMLMLVTAALTWPAIAFHAGATPTEFDQDNFHSAVIRQMAAELPWPHLSQYNAAMAPGYHLVLALIVRATGAGPMALQWINSLVGLALVGIAAHVAAKFTSPWRAAALVAPFAVSNPVVSASIWIATDNPAWLCVALALAAMITTSRGAARQSWRGVAWATAATAIRQIHVWLAAPLIFAAYRSSEGRASRDRGAKLRRAAVGVVIIAAPVAALAWLWGGLTPPAFRAQHNGGINLTALPFMLACMGMFGLAFLPLVFVNIDRRTRAGVAMAAAAGAALAAAIPTSFDHDHGRWGGVLWTLVAHTPAVAQRSILMMLLAAIGAATLVCLWRSARDRGRADEASVVLVALAGLAAAQAANSMVWERYFEPPVLLSLAWLTAMASPHIEKRRWAALGLLVALLIAVTLSSIYLRPYLR